MPLTRQARETIKWSGITIAAYVRDQMPYSGQDGRTWRGDDCGCSDDRCIGYHHEEWDDCGCLPVLIRETADRLAAHSSPISETGEQEMKNDSDWEGAIERTALYVAIQEAIPWVMSNLDDTIWFDPATGERAAVDDPRWVDPRPATELLAPAKGAPVPPISETGDARG